MGMINQVVSGCSGAGEGGRSRVVVLEGWGVVKGVLSMRPGHSWDVLRAGMRAGDGGG